MIGLFGYISKKHTEEVNEYDFFQGKDFLEDSYSVDNFFIKRKLNTKFQNDKVFNSDQNCFIAVDGVILNFKQLKAFYKQPSNFALLNYLYSKNGKGFINELKGDFSLVVYDKIKQELTVYTNLTTSKPIYYYHYENNHELFFASNAFVLFDFLKSRKKKLSVNTLSFYSVASYGYVFSDNHFTNEIKKLDGGNYLSFNTNFSKSNYFKFTSFPQVEFNETKCLGLIDELFNESIKLQYEKDLAYNYKHLSTLSGGLDSRMATLIGLKNGFDNIDTITFSSPGYWDEIIARSISRKNKIKNTIYAVKNGRHLLEYDFSLHINGGLLSYYVANQMSQLYMGIDFVDYGLLHTGQVGDAIIGSTLHNYKSHKEGAYFKPKYIGGNHNELEYLVEGELDKNDSVEICKFSNHVFNYTLEGNQYIYPYTESVSPFLDKDLLSFCLRIPLKLRNKHNLYYKWIEQYHPEVGVFFYEKTKRRTIKFKNRYFNKMYHEYMKKYLKLKGLKQMNNSLLNFNEWSKDEMLINKLNKTFYHKIDIIAEPKLKQNLEDQFKNEDFQIKLKALHALLTYELYFY